MQAGQIPDVKDYYQETKPPDEIDLNYQLEQLVQQGVISPEDAQAALAERSEMDNVSLDPNIKKAQMDALLGLQDISDSGGMTLADESNLQKIANDEATRSRGSREAILQNAQSRGLGGSGLELMSQMQNQQDAATRQNTRDMDVASQAQQRALEALMQGGQLAGNIQNQDFNQQAQKAQAQDAIAKFNAQNQQQTNMANTQARNAAQAGNLDLAQGISNANTGLRNQQSAQQSANRQQAFQNRMQQAGGSTQIGMRNAESQGKNSIAQREAERKNAEMIGSMFMSDARAKKDVEKFSPSEFLDSITSYKYKYKEPKKYGDGDHVGVMAQDMEKTEMGSKLISDSPEGKMIDYAKAGPQIMASLADINERLRKMEGGENA